MAITYRRSSRRRNRRKKPMTRYVTAKKGWYRIGRRKFYFKSHWELKYACYLQHLKLEGSIRSWDYEKDNFSFPGYSRGAIYYLPDFKIRTLDKKTLYVEVKGWETSRDRTKWKRFRKHYPEFQLDIVKANWFNDHKDLTDTLVLKYSKELIK